MATADSEDQPGCMIGLYSNREVSKESSLSSDSALVIAIEQYYIDMVPYTHHMETE